MLRLILRGAGRRLTANQSIAACASAVSWRRRAGDHGTERCINFGALRVDQAVEEEV